MAEKQNQDLSEKSELTSSRFFRQTALDRRRPSKRQTTVRSFKIKRTWSSATFSSSAGTDDALPTQPEDSVDLPPTQELSIVPPTPDQHNDEMSVKSNAKSPAVEPTSSLSSDALHQPQASPQRPNSPQPHPQESTESDPLVSSTQFGSCDGSPSSIVLENSEEKFDDIESVDNEADYIRTPSSISDEKVKTNTPLSGPGILKAVRKRGRKRKINEALSMQEGDEESWENDYRENNFVRLFNADRRQGTSVADLTDLDVILTVIEEEALNLRNEIDSSVGKKAIKEFFIQMKKAFNDMIEIKQENKIVKSDLRKSKARINKLRKGLLGVQQKRSRCRKY
ncbi:PREDICTED: uncharacterized protein LOC107352909 [Acropora digitifera]|uniref:uncharacterized protein LOC107352909 n=1 Tax=Acropora digitifera TaxID=70779 RepID=UPI00077A46B6|nr:PREDICTED: uncharacterized protein LOC107352909 [Acropora digitifera]